MHNHLKLWTFSAFAAYGRCKLLVFPGRFPVFNPLLPRTAGLGLAPILLGRLPDKVRELVAAGSLPTLRVGKRSQIALDTIEAKTGMRISPTAYLYAQRQHD